VMGLVRSLGRSASWLVGCSTGWRLDRAGWARLPVRAPSGARPPPHITLFWACVFHGIIGVGDPFGQLVCSCETRCYGLYQLVVKRAVG